jgi:hypothetical protein
VIPPPKLPRSYIYWTYITKYLEIKDMASFDAAVDCHLNRRGLQLMLPPPSVREGQQVEMTGSSIFPHDEYLQNIPSSVIDSSKAMNPYESLLTIAHSYQVELLSEEMRLWCEKRRIVFTNVKLRYNPSAKLLPSLPGITSIHQELALLKDEEAQQASGGSKEPRSSSPGAEVAKDKENSRAAYSQSPGTEQAADDDLAPEIVYTFTENSASHRTKKLDAYTRAWNLLHYVKYLTIGNEFGCLSITWNCQEIFPQLHSLESITCTQNALSDFKDIQCLIDQVMINAARDISIEPGPHELDTVILRGWNYPSQLYSSLITSVPSIKTFEVSSSKISRSHLAMIGWHWPGLQSININGWLKSKLSDKDLDNFYDHGNQQHFRCVYFTDCPKISVAGLIPFLFNSSESLRELRLDCYDEEKLCWKLLPLCPQLEVLDVSLSGHYSDKLIESVSRNNHQLRKLNVIHAMCSHSFTDYGLKFLTIGCKNIEALLLGKCPNITIRSFETFRSAYRNSLRKVFIVNSDIRALLRQAPEKDLFEICRHRVILSMQFS